MNVKYHNQEYSGGYPLAVGDRYYSQDIFRDLRYHQEYLGELMKRIYGKSNIIIKGLVVTQGTGHTINITAGSAVIDFDVTVPDSWSGIPPTTKTETIPIMTDVSAYTNQAITSVVTDGVTTNYVKVTYNESKGSSRARAIAVGNYNSEITASHTLTVDDTAPTSNEIAIATFTSDGATLTFLDKKMSIRRSNTRNTSFIIASSDSSEIDRLSSDIVINTTTDTGFIINEIFSYITSKVSINFKQGTFNFDTSVNVVESCHISGKGQSTVLHANSSFDIFLIADINDVTIQSLYFNSGKYCIYVNNSSAIYGYHYINNIYGTTTMTNLIRFFNCIDSTIKDCMNGAEIFIINSTKIRVSNNQFESVSFSSCSHCIMNGNQIGQGTFSQKIQLSTCTDMVVSNNNIEATASFTSGIYLSSSSNRNSIVGNSIHATGSNFYGINLSSSDDNSIIGNIAFGSTAGIILDATSDYNTVIGNITGSGAATSITDLGAGNVVANNE